LGNRVRGVKPHAAHVCFCDGKGNARWSYFKKTNNKAGFRGHTNGI